MLMLTAWSSFQCEFSFTARGGIIKEATLKLPGLENVGAFDGPGPEPGLEGTNIFELQSWSDSFARLRGSQAEHMEAKAAAAKLASWLDGIFGLRTVDVTSKDPG